MNIIDTHCHIHGSQYELDAEVVLQDALNAGVQKLICVGTDVDDSGLAAHFAITHKGCWASIGIHPHEAKKEQARMPELDRLAQNNSDQAIVAVGEIGLDYYYQHSPKREQQEVLHAQLELAKKYNLPIIFHVRDAFDDFFSIFDQHPDTKGVVHSFTAGRQELESILSRGLLVGINGIMTFTKRIDQIDAARLIPIESMVLETDAPFLTPVPKRGNVNRPEFIWHTARHVADLRGETIESFTAQTTKNAQELFNI